MTARSMRVGLGFGPKTLRVTRTLINALGVPVALRPSNSSARTLSVTRALVPAAGQNVTLTYSGSTIAAPTLFALVQQGGVGNDGSGSPPLSNSNAFTWKSVAGATSYKIYRRTRTSSFSNSSFGTAYATVTASTAASNFTTLSGATTLVFQSGTNCAYTDTAATNNNIVDLTSAPTVYQYVITAFDGANESAQVTPECIIYSGDSNTASIGNGYGSSTTVTNDTSGSPVPGPHDVKVVFSSAGGGWLPYLTPPICAGANTYPNDLEIGGFNYWQIDVKVTDTQYLTNPLNFGITTRIPPGDAFSWTTHNLWDYCTPSVNNWVTARIPITALTKGITTFTGRIVGTGAGVGTLTATVTAPNFVDNSAYIYGSGVPAGTYTNGVGTITDANGSGTYTVNGPNITGATDTGTIPMTYQCTGFYKSGFQPGTDTNMTVYFNNWKLTTI
jgi:hypothetical protein